VEQESLADATVARATAVRVWRPPAKKSMANQRCDFARTQCGSKQKGTRSVQN